jgi:hypothetical protein
MKYSRASLNPQKPEMIFAKGCSLVANRAIANAVTAFVKGSDKPIAE